MASRLFDAAQCGDLNRLQDIVCNKGISVKSSDRTNATALHIACDWGHMDCVQYLIQSGADVNAVDNFGRTPLTFAKREGWSSIIALLLENGALSESDLANKKKVVKPRRVRQERVVQQKPNNEKEQQLQETQTIILTSRPNSANDSPSPMPVASLEDYFEEACISGFDSTQVEVASLEISSPPTSRSRLKFADIIETIARQESDEPDVGAEQETQPEKVSEEIQEQERVPRSKTVSNRSRSKSPGTRKSPKRAKSKSPSSSKREVTKKDEISVDHNPLCDKDIQFFKSSAFTAKEQVLLMRMNEAVIHIFKDGVETYTVNTRVLLNENAGKVAVCMHGFGWCQSGMVWSKMVEPLYRSGFSVVLVDLPGFGRSSGDNLQTRIWKHDGPEILLNIINGLEITVPVTVFGYCGGGATFMRTFSKQWNKFSKRHVLHNCVIGEWPEGLDPKLASTGTKMYVTWNVDIDHSVHCVAYKHLYKLRKTNFGSVRFDDIDDEYLGSGCANRLTGISRSNVVHYFEPSEEYIQTVLSHLKGAYL
jgi:hypothetical protein